MPAKKKTAPAAKKAPARKSVPKKAAAPVEPVIFEGEVFARTAAGFADDKKAENLTILDVRGISMVADFLVICEGSSLPHLRAIQNEVASRLKHEHGVRAYAAHGMADSGWMLLDYGDVVIHIFHAEKRAFYGLEDLWNDAPRLTL
jgi:ribosome-associated protein